MKSTTTTRPLRSLPFLAIFLLLSIQLTTCVPTDEASCSATQLERIQNADGFLAALDQSGGSTPKALQYYGVPDDAYVVGEESMYDQVHAMRTRIMTSPAFHGDRILGAILFERTMDSPVEGMPSATYLWQVKNIIPFLKCDQGLEEPVNGVQLMKPMPNLEALLQKAKSKGIFGTKMRSVILTNNREGIEAVVKQQFDIGKQILRAGLIPIIEPEVDIHSPTKRECEEGLKACLLEHLNQLEEDQKVMLKLSLPSVENFYKEFVEHPNCLRVVALSGGYSRDEANTLLAKQKGMIASFSRALTEGLEYHMTDEQFDKTLDASIQSIVEASRT